VKAMCSFFNISRAAYYEWVKLATQYIGKLNEEREARGEERIRRIKGTTRGAFQNRWLSIDEWREVLGAHGLRVVDVNERVVMLDGRCFAAVGAYGGLAEVLMSGYPVEAASTAAGTSVSGGLFADTTWSLANSPYHVTADVTLFPGFTLTIEPGVQVKFSPGVGLNIRGSLIAEGTFGSGIVFGAVTPGTKGSWGGIRVNNTLGGSASVKFSTISDAASALSVECCWSGGPVSVSNSAFINNVTALCGYAGWTMTVESSIFENIKCLSEFSFLFGRNCLELIKKKSDLSFFTQIRF